ncbi:hypothetical protein ABZX85_47250 [Streptomyces sp. NPDC004539]|uniref:hypothetical protein n=1 Tax=Streptomyces sp. NPDC004539 TaxID=3154280 RepID=UPI0033BAF4F3
MTLELLRNRWTYSVLVALLDGPLPSGLLLLRINAGAARNAELVGPYVLRAPVLLARLRQMETEGLLLTRHADPGGGKGSDLEELTQAGRELLNSLWRVSGWATDRREHLTFALLRHRRHQQRNSGGDELRLAAEVLTPEQESRRATGLALGVLRTRWAFAVLCQLDHGAQRPTAVTEAVNAGVGRNRDLTKGRSLSEKVFWDTLHRLVDAGLAVHRPRPGQIASTARCTPTPAGRALLDALTPVGEWAVEHEEDLLTIVRRRRGLADPGGL